MSPVLVGFLVASLTHERKAPFQAHLKELVLEHAPPPPALAQMAVASLVKMGFPQRAAEGLVAICACHREVKIGGGFTCPRCKARVCELPTQCHICGLTLVSSPHLARSYHHLFPVPPFEEVAASALMNGRQHLLLSCFGCQQELPLLGEQNHPNVVVNIDFIYPLTSCFAPCQGERLRE